MGTVACIISRVIGIKIEELSTNELVVAARSAMA
jgi:hypothetical protein